MKIMGFQDAGRQVECSITSYKAAVKTLMDETGKEAIKMF